MKRVFAVIAMAATALYAQELKPEKIPEAGKDGWVSMFDGKTLDGWKASEHPENWKVQDGVVIPVSTLPDETER